MSDFAPTAFPPEKPRTDLPAGAPIVETPIGTFAPPAGAAIAAGGAYGPPLPPVQSPAGGFRSEDRRSLDNRRVGAYLIDLLVLAAAAIALTLALGYGPWVYLVYPAIFLTYFFVFEAVNGQTIGKRAMKLRVVHIGGGPANTLAVGGRTVLRLVDGQMGGLVGLCTMLLTRRRRQRLGDLATGTVVRRDDRPYTPPARSPLLLLYPVLWIGAAFLISLQLGLLGQQDPPMHSYLTSDPYMRTVNDVCKRRVARVRAAGGRVTFEEATRNAELEYGGIVSLPPPPAGSRAAYRRVVRYERSWVRRIHRLGARVSVSHNPAATRAAELEKLGAFVDRADAAFRDLGLPYCAQ